MRLGASRAEQRAEGQVAYYTPNNSSGSSACGETQVPWPYGGFYFEAMDAHGGWLASAVDLARFAAALDGGASSALLKPETLDVMYRRPGPPVAIDKNGKPAS